MKEHAPEVLSATTMIGDKVRNPNGDDLGKIEEIMIDRHDGHVAYAVLSFGGVLGMGDKLFAVPWQVLTVDTEQKCFILNADKESLKNAPGFDKDNWPRSADQTFLEKVYAYYDVQPYYGVNA